MGNCLVEIGARGEASCDNAGFTWSDTLPAMSWLRSQHSNNFLPKELYSNFAADIKLQMCTLAGVYYRFRISAGNSGIEL